MNRAKSSGIALFKGATNVVHWLREIGLSGFDYEIEIAPDGFASLLPAGQDALSAMWRCRQIFGPASGGQVAIPGAVQRHATTLAWESALCRETSIDLRISLSSETSLANTSDSAAKGHAVLAEFE